LGAADGSASGSAEVSRASEVLRRDFSEAFEAIGSRIKAVENLLRQALPDLTALQHNVLNSSSDARADATYQAVLCVERQLQGVTGKLSALASEVSETGPLARDVIQGHFEALLKAATRSEVAMERLAGGQSELLQENAHLRSAVDSVQRSNDDLCQRISALTAAQPRAVQAINASVQHGTEAIGQQLSGLSAQITSATTVQDAHASAIGSRLDAMMDAVTRIRDDALGARAGAERAVGEMVRIKSSIVVVERAASVEAIAAAAREGGRSGAYAGAAEAMSAAAAARRAPVPPPIPSGSGQKPTGQASSLRTPYGRVPH
jgi:chromosome segregation ATPase